MTPCPAGRAALSVIGTTAALGRPRWPTASLRPGAPCSRRIDVPVLAADEEPLTVLHLADLHLTGHTEARVAWVRRLAQLQPDASSTPATTSPWPPGWSRCGGHSNH